jgi:hypothetical protein
MKIVQGDEMPVVTGRNLRQGNLNKQYLIHGETGSPGNFVFGIYNQNGDFFSPRHHHNFDQWRFHLEGENPGMGMRPGVLGYYPEGAFYGPSKAEQPTATVLVQFGGPSGSGYLSQEQVYAAGDAMKALGRFEGGVYHRNEGVPGKKTMDAFEATWEFANKRKLVYPQPQYAAPLLIDTNNYRWMPLDGAPGVEEKAFGTFTDCKIRAGRYKLDPGATFRATGRGLFLVLSGAGSLEGEPFRKLTALYLDSGESAAFAAQETSEILLLGLPDVARMRKPLPEGFSGHLRADDQEHALLAQHDGRG